MQQFYFMKYLCVVFISILSITCGKNKNNKNAILDRYHYDKKVITNLPKYEKFRQLVLSNFDTIFKFRNSQNLIDHYEGNKVTKKQVNGYSYEFIKNEKPNSQLPEQMQFENVPANIYPVINQSFNVLGSQLEGFSLSRDSTIEFIFKKQFDQKTNIEIGHRLTWHKRKLLFFNDPTVENTIKDTVLSNGWIYYIFAKMR